MLSRRMAELCDASAVSPRKVGPAREPCDLYAGHAWTRQGTEGFLGQPRCQGQTSGDEARRHEALILMGDWCGAQSRRQRNEDTDASERANRGWSVPSGTQRQNCQKLSKGEVLPLDGSLLMGDFSVVLFRPHFMLVSEEYLMKSHKNQWLLTLLSLPELPYGGTNQGTCPGA
jgi:hypothetical protein